MPLNDGAVHLIRANLEQVRNGRRPRVVVIGKLTKVQLDGINKERSGRNLPPINEEVVFLGRHIYDSRIVRDGYTIDDVLEQITSSMDTTSIVRPSPKMTVIENPRPRLDRYGNTVKDQAIFECTGRFPRAELYSVIPTGDNARPKAKRTAVKRSF
jgi:hypothetical protein